MCAAARSPSEAGPFFLRGLFPAGGSARGSARLILTDHLAQAFPHLLLKIIPEAVVRQPLARWIGTAAALDVIHADIEIRRAVRHADAVAQLDQPVVVVEDETFINASNSWYSASQRSLGVMAVSISFTANECVTQIFAGADTEGKEAISVAYSIFRCYHE